MSELAEIFAKDPQEYSKQDLREVIAAMREARVSFNKGNMKAGNTKPRTEKQKQHAELAQSLSLDDLLK